MSNTVTTQKNTSKKAKALLAGGLVLGVGAVVTLASWTDQEWASASFSSGEFVLESSTNGTDFTSHESVDESAQLQFDVPTATNLSPGQKLATPFALRLNEDTTRDAVVTTSEPTGNDIGLKYDVELVNSVEACNTTPAATNERADEFHLSAGGGTSPGTAQILCFHVEALPELEQAQSTNPTWTFHATLDESPN